MTRDFPRIYGRRFVPNFTHAGMDVIIKLENKIKFENSKTGKNLTMANTVHGQNTRENHFWH